MQRTKALGRPPGANSEETRRRILDVARKHLGERGYAKATLKEISNEAGLTSGAIYYYFESKQALVNALILETHEAIEERFAACAAEAGPSLPSKLVAVLEAQLDTLEQDPELARFAVTVRVDGPRYPELIAAVQQSSRAYAEFYRNLAEKAVAAGEVKSDVTPQQVADMCSVLSLGLTALALQIPQARYRRAIRAVERLVEGSMFTAMATKGLNTNGRRRR